MTVFTKTGQLARRLARGLIHRLWVKPLEIRIIPRLSKEKPGRVQSRLLRMSIWSANAGRVLLEELRLSVIRWSGPDWSVTYIGNGFSAEALGFFLFPEPQEVRESSTTYLWRAPGLVRKFTGEGDLVVCELNRIIHLSPKNVNLAFSSPQWIDLTIEGIDRPLDEVMGKIHPSVRSRIRRLECQGFHSTTTHSEADFDLFYHRMYVPYVETRHNGHGAIVRDHDYVHRFFEKGILLLVEQNEKLVSGSICQISGNTCLGVLLGVMDGQYELVKQGAIVSLCWSVIQWARGQGAQRFDLGASRPMIHNGVFVFKRQWGAQVFRDQEVYTQWNFFGNNIPAKLRDYLNQQGLITETPKGHALVVLLDPGGIFEEEDLANRLKHLPEFGLIGALLISTKGERQLIPCTAVEVDPYGSAHLVLNELPVN